MLTFVIRRVLLFLPILIGLTIVVFLITHVFSDPAAMYYTKDLSPSEVQRIREKHGFNRPYIVQYFSYLNRLVHVDLGYSTSSRSTILQAFAKKIPATFELALTSLLFAVILGVRLGLVSAIRKGTIVDQVTRISALAGFSLPLFWVALVLLLFFYVDLGWLPLGRYSSKIWPLSQHHTNFYLLDAVINGSWRQFVDAIRHLILPTITLGYYCLGLITRMMRSSVLEVAQKDYVRTARAKGLREEIVNMKHIRQNALLPTITVIGFTFGGLMMGSVLTETVFSWPGLGSWAVKAIKNNDTAAIMNYVLLVGVIYSVVNLLVDISYGYINPKVRLD